METYFATYKFEEKGVRYEAKVKGIVFDKANEEIDFNYVSDLPKGFATQILNAVCFAINKDNSVMMFDAQLMQSNANKAYSALISGDLFPISMDITIQVASSPLELLQRSKKRE